MLGSDSRAQIFLCVKFDTLENVSILTHGGFFRRVNFDTMRFVYC